MTPTPVRSCIGRLRRRTSLLPLWGKNFAQPGGFFLQALLESLARPLAPFGFHFQLDLPQGPGARYLWLHPFPFVRGFTVLLG